MKQREYYYKMPDSTDAEYEDYLEYCEFNSIEPEFMKDDVDALYQWVYDNTDWEDQDYLIKESFAEMIADIIKDKTNNKDYDVDLSYMYFYVRGNAVGWRRGSARSEIMDIINVLDLFGNGAYEDIELYRDMCDDGTWGYTMRLAGHDSTDYFDIIPMHESFIEDILFDLLDNYSLEEIIEYIGYYEFNDMKNIITLIENTETLFTEDVICIVKDITDEKYHEILETLIKKVHNEQ